MGISFLFNIFQFGFTIYLQPFLIKVLVTRLRTEQLPYTKTPRKGKGGKKGVRHSKYILNLVLINEVINFRGLYTLFYKTTPLTTWREVTDIIDTYQSLSVRIRSWYWTYNSGLFYDSCVRLPFRNNR